MLCCIIIKWPLLISATDIIIFNFLSPIFCMNGASIVVKKMTFLKKSFYLANSIVLDAISAVIFVMDHCKINFYFITNKFLNKILLTFDLLTYFI